MQQSEKEENTSIKEQRIQDIKEKNKLLLEQKRMDINNKINIKENSVQKVLLKKQNWIEESKYREEKGN